MLRARAGRLTTPRLTLEPLTVEHAGELAALLGDPALHAFVGGRPEAEAELRVRYARQVVGHSPDGRQTWLNWVARERETGAPVGTVQATVTEDGAELAWVVATPCQGRGLASEAAVAMRDWLRAHGVTSFSASVHPEHAASAAVARRLGLAPTDTRVGIEVRWEGG